MAQQSSGGEHRAQLVGFGNRRESDAALDGSWINLQLREDGRMEVLSVPGGPGAAVTIVLSRKSVRMVRALLNGEL